MIKNFLGFILIILLLSGKESNEFYLIKNQIKSNDPYVTIPFINENVEYLEYSFIDEDFSSIRPDLKSFRLRTKNNKISGLMFKSDYSITFVIKHNNKNKIIRSINKRDFKLVHDIFEPLICHVNDFTNNTIEYSNRNQYNHNKKLYRLAIATSPQFYNANGNNVFDVQDVVFFTVGVVNNIFENNTGVGFTLLTPVLFDSVEGSPFQLPNPNNPNYSRISISMEAINTQYSKDDFDVGHTLHNSAGQPIIPYGSGGVAVLNAVCNNMTLSFTNGYLKSGGWSGTFNNTTFNWFRIVAHELGHQFGATHTFNGSGGGCGVPGAYNPTSSYEIGSGTTIMSYRGNCTSTYNVPHMGELDNYFHVHNILQIQNFVNNIATCNIDVPFNKETININLDCNYNTIPANTPFKLIGSIDNFYNFNVTFNWEQYDLGTQGLIGVEAANDLTAPLFRNYPPSNDIFRFIPVQNNNFEVLPLVDRDINFQFVVKDNYPNFGSVYTEKITLNVDSSIKFDILNPKNGDILSENFNLLWDNYGSDFICDSITIYISVDGGTSYNSGQKVPNTGIFNIIVPETNEGKIKITCDVSSCVRIYSFSGVFEVTNKKTLNITTKKIDGSPINNVNIFIHNIDNNILLNGFTDINGYYGVNIMDNVNYKVWGVLDNPITYLTNQDAISIINHINASSPITNPYLKIASDLNNNNFIEISDVIMINKIIDDGLIEFLDPYTGNKINNSWKFIYDNVIDDYPESPFIPYYSDTIYFYSDDNKNINFIGVLMGSVHTQQNNINIHPNPFNELIYVESNISGNIEIYSISGKYVGSFPIEMGVNNINTYNIPIGIYLVFINSEIYKIIKL